MLFSKRNIMILAGLIAVVASGTAALMIMNALSNTDPQSTLLRVGTEAPDFDLKATGGKRISLDDLKGSPTVLVFYPGDNTPGCTIQLCALRDTYDQFHAVGAHIIAANPASLESHQNFAQSQQYPFPILVDTDMEMAANYGSKGMLFPIRTVYIIDSQGAIAYASRGMPTPEELLAKVKELSQSSEPIPRTR